MPNVYTDESLTQLVRGEGVVLVCLSVKLLRDEDMKHPERVGVFP